MQSEEEEEEVDEDIDGSYGKMGKKLNLCRSPAAFFVTSVEA